MASLPSVSPGSVPTESAGNGSAAFDIEAELAAQMDRNELSQAGAAFTPSPEEYGGYDPPGEDFGDEVEYEVEGGGWSAHPVTTFDDSVYTAHQDFLRAASQFVSPMGYDVPSPSDVVGDTHPVAAYNLNTSSALGFVGESAIDAFNRQSAMGASAMGYDAPSPNGVPGGYAYPPGPLSVGPSDPVDMNDSTKRGRVYDAPRPWLPP